MVLYVPAGFPHTTDTINTAEAGDAADDDSVHLTIGLDTHIWGLDYAALRTTLAQAVLGRLQQLTYLRVDSNQLTSLPPGVTSIGELAFYQCGNLALTSLPPRRASNWARSWKCKSYKV